MYPLRRTLPYAQTICPVNGLGVGSFFKSN